MAVPEQGAGLGRNGRCGRCQPDPLCDSVLGALPGSRIHEALLCTWPTTTPRRVRAVPMRIFLPPYAAAARPSRCALSLPVRNPKRGRDALGLARRSGPSLATPGAEGGRGWRPSPRQTAAGPGTAAARREAGRAGRDVRARQEAGAGGAAAGPRRGR
ncbi:unnamed protein product [Coccothraustes coccothraustes]